MLYGGGPNLPEFLAAASASAMLHKLRMKLISKIFRQNTLGVN